MQDSVKDDESLKNDNIQYLTIIAKLKETLKVQLVKEFYNQGFKESDIITKEAWFLKDIINSSDMIFTTPGGPGGPSKPKQNKSQRLTPQSPKSSFL